MISNGRQLIWKEWNEKLFYSPIMPTIKVGGLVKVECLLMTQSSGKTKFDPIPNNTERNNTEREHYILRYFSLFQNIFVRFNLNPEVHMMYAWSYAYKSARKGHWESLARDRDRFRKRIENTSKYINPILTPEHRSFIYNSRFDKKCRNENEFK